MGEHQIAYSVVLCFVVLEWRDGYELRRRRGSLSSAVTLKGTRPKDLWKPCSGFIPYTTEEVTHELSRVASPRHCLVRLGRTKEEGAAILVTKVAFVDSVIFCTG